MPWQTNGGDGDKPNPWGSGPRRSGGGHGGGDEPPHIDEIIRKSQDRLKDILPGGKGGAVLMALAVVFLWLLTGVYHVDTGEQAAVLRFGKYSETAGAGLHWHLPYPFERAEIRNVTNENTVEVGSNALRSRRGGVTGGLGESLMLTGDENIVDVKFNVVWRIGDLSQYLFNLKDHESTIKSVSESVIRELVGKSGIVSIITTGRGQLQADGIEMIQRTLDNYNSGVTVLRVQILESQAPNEVKEAFLDVQAAEADQQRFINEAGAYKEQVVPEARGEAQQMLQQAEGYAAEVVARAEGEAGRFQAIYNEYRVAKSVTRKRLYLETMEEILSGMDKIILDSEAGSGVVPYLPLDQMGKRKKQGGNNNE